MRVALVQMTSTDDLSANLESARLAVISAVEQGAEFIALPENFAFLRREGKPIPCAQGLDGEIIGSVRELARQHGVPIGWKSNPELSSEKLCFSCTQWLRYSIDRLPLVCTAKGHPIIYRFRP